MKKEKKCYVNEWFDALDTVSCFFGIDDISMNLIHLSNELKLGFDAEYNDKCLDAILQLKEILSILQELPKNRKIFLLKNRSVNFLREMTWCLWF